MRKSFLAIFILFLPCILCSSQEILPGAAIVAPAGEEGETLLRLQLALSNENYPVTPGDIYRLTFLSAGEAVTNQILVQSDYAVNIAYFGKLNAEDKTFLEFKTEVEELISSGYPNSMPFLNISAVGFFQVLIRGEVLQTRFATAWGLSRLSDVIQESLGPYSSARDITLLSKDGTRRRCDLFKALRFGIASDNPYIKPGDTIEITGREKLVQIAGGVRRPGQYELIGDEELSDLIEFCGGFTAPADASRIRLVRMSARKVRTVYLDLSSGIDSGISLHDGDTLFVPSIIENIPVVFVEGAVTIPGAIGAAGAEPAAGVAAAVSEGYRRITFPFAEGETLYNALSSLRNSISPNADLSNASIVRNGDIIPVDLQSLLYNYSPASDTVLEPFDRIVIPENQFYVSVTGTVENAGNYPYSPRRKFSYYVGLAGGYIPEETVAESIIVMDSNGNLRDPDELIRPEDRIYVSAPRVSVTGAVFDPSNYPYAPGREYAYYLSLAGGIDPERNTNNQVTITDSEGNKRSPDAIVQPGDRIFVNSNSFVYNFNRYFPIITTGIAFITTIIAIVNLLAN